MQEHWLQLVVEGDLLRVEGWSLQLQQGHHIFVLVMPCMCMASEIIRASKNALACPGVHVC